MRTSGCMARIAGSMKPQLRKWPMVAGSARTSFWTRRASSWGGSGLRVNTAKLLDVGERAIAQPPDVAAGVDHVVAALEHLAPGRAGMRHRAHRLTAFPDAFLGARDQLLHLGVLEITELADGAGKIVRPDEEHIDAVDRGDRLHVLYRLGRLDLADDQELVGCRLAVLGCMDAIVGGASRAKRRAAPAGGRIAARRNYCAGILGRLYVGDHNAFHTGVEHALQIVGVVGRYPHDGCAVRCSRHRLQRMEQRRGLAEAMFLVEQQVVEAAQGQELDHRRGAEHGPAAERALARSQPRLEMVWAKHGPSIQFRSDA